MGIDKYIDEITSENYNHDLAYSSDWLYEPPTFMEYITSGNYIAPVKLTSLQLDAVMQVVGNDPKKIFAPNRKYDLGVLVVGKGGGKDWLIAKVLGWIYTVLLHMRNSQKFLGIDGNLDIINVATNQTQATQVFFPYFIETIKGNKWILDNFTVTESGKNFSIAKNPIDTLNIFIDKVIARNKRIRCFSMTSANESWEGYNVVFFVLDEISGFTSENDIENGWKIFKTAETSCLSRIQENFKGLGYVFSYPRAEKNDIVIELFKRSLTSPGKEHIYGAFAFSWEFRPYPKRGTFTFVSKRFNRFFGEADDKIVGIEVPIDLKNKFDEDPEGSMTMFCCLPPRQSGDWLEYPEKAIACIDKVQQPLFATEDYVSSETVDGVEFNYLGKRIAWCNEKDYTKLKDYSYVAWLDSAWKACDAVIAIARKEQIRVPLREGGEEVLDICRIVDLITWTPRPGYVVDLRNVEDFLTTKIKDYINLVEVGADQFESAVLSQKLVRNGIKPLLINLSSTHYDVLKRELYKGTVRIFDEEQYPPPSGKELTGIDQLTSLRTGSNGPERRRGIKKDKADAICGVVNMLLGNIFTKQNRPKSQNFNKLPGIIVDQIKTNSPFSGNPSGQSTKSFNTSGNLPNILKG